MMNTMHHVAAWPWQGTCAAALAIWLSALLLGLHVISDAAASPPDELCEAQSWDRPVEQGATRRGRDFVSVLDWRHRRMARRPPARRS